MTPKRDAGTPPENRAAAPPGGPGGRSEATGRDPQRRNEPPDPDARRPCIVWEERSVRCVHCSSSPETPGLIGLNRDGEPVCSTHLMLECEQLSYGLRILKLVASVYDRWPGGPPRKHRIPEYWDSPHYLGP